MRIYGDYHTHTYFSDGKRSVAENLKAASEKALNAVAISDHGFNNPSAFSLTRRKAAEQARIIAEERLKYGEMKILHAIEADIIGTNGEIDMNEEDFETFDFVLFGFHRFARPARGRDFFDIYVPAYFSGIFKPSVSVIERNTRAFCKAIEKYPVAVVAHINDMVVTDAGEVAKAAADNGVYMEINVKHLGIMRRSMDKMLATDVKFLANTDAHTPAEVGDFSALEDFIKEYPESYPRIANAYPDEIKFRKRQY